MIYGDGLCRCRLWPCGEDAHVSELGRSHELRRQRRQKWKSILKLSTQRRQSPQSRCSSKVQDSMLPVFLLANLLTGAGNLSLVSKWEIFLSLIKILIWYNMIDMIRCLKMSQVGIFQCLMFHDVSWCLMMLDVCGTQQLWVNFGNRNFTMSTWGCECGLSAFDGPILARADLRGFTGWVREFVTGSQGWRRFWRSFSGFSGAQNCTSYGKVDGRLCVRSHTENGKIILSSTDCSRCWGYHPSIFACFCIRYSHYSSLNSSQILQTTRIVPR